MTGWWFGWWLSHPSEKKIVGMEKQKIFQTTQQMISHSQHTMVHFDNTEQSFVLDRTQVHGGRPAIVISRLLILLKVAKNGDFNNGLIWGKI